MPKISVQVGAPAGADPIEFELTGFASNGSPIKLITFRCKQELQGVVLTNMFKDDQLGTGLEVMALIEKAIIPEQLDLWNQIINGDDVVVNIKALSEIAKGLVEAYSGNPTSGPAASSNGYAPTGPTSVADYLSAPGETLRPSAPIISGVPPIQ